MKDSYYESKNKLKLLLHQNPIIQFVCLNSPWNTKHRSCKCYCWFFYLLLLFTSNKHRNDFQTLKSWCDYFQFDIVQCVHGTLSRMHNIQLNQRIFFFSPTTIHYSLLGSAAIISLVEEHKFNRWKMHIQFHWSNYHSVIKSLVFRL